MLTTQDDEVASPMCSTRPLPEPLLSSRSRRWNGIVVELRRGRDIDVVLPYRDHVIAVVLAGGANLHQCRNGQSSHRTLRSGDVIVTPAGEPKRWQHTGDAVAIALRLAPTYLEKVAAEEHAPQVGQAQLDDNFGTRDPYVEEIAIRLLKALEAESAATRIYIESLTLQLAVHLLRHHSLHSISDPVPEQRSATLSQRKLRRAVEYVEAHLGDDLTLTNIAAALAMSSSHFAHAFRQTVGMPPHRYVLQRRIERAKSLLRDSDSPIAEIAQRIGCSSPSSFSFLFHRTTGVTPRNYRSGEPCFAFDSPVGGEIVVRHRSGSETHMLSIVTGLSFPKTRSH
jgi:AraC family transcriptional regulator